MLRCLLRKSRWTILDEIWYGLCRNVVAKLTISVSDIRNIYIKNK